MINFLINKDSLNKIILLTCIFLAPFALSAEINTKKWVKQCNQTNKECVIAIKKEVSAPGSDKKQTLSTAYIRISAPTAIKKKVILYVNLPFNSDLRKRPLIQVDKKAISNLSYRFCNKNVGCSSFAELNDEAVSLFKSGKELIITIGIFGDKVNKLIKFPLKDFSKSYKLLIK